MKYEFKRGQIVPKKLGSRFVSIHKKARHNILFGCDVKVTVTLVALKVVAKSGGAIFFIKKSPKRKRDNGTYQECNAYFRNIHAEPWPDKAPAGIHEGRSAAGIRLALETVNEPMANRDTIARPQHNKT